MEGERVRIPKGNLEMLAELENPENYRQHFKDKCFICERKIPASWGHYRFFGNCCRFCNITKKKGHSFVYKKDICKRGHVLTSDNVYIVKGGFRNCRLCTNLRTKNWYHRQKSI